MAGGRKEEKWKRGTEEQRKRGKEADLVAALHWPQGNAKAKGRAAVQSQSELTIIPIIPIIPLIPLIVIR